MVQNINAPLNFRHQNTLITTKKPHQPFKSETQMKNSVFSFMKRPANNGDVNNAEDYIGPHGMATVRKAFPMKHWRRQLHSSTNNGRSKASVYDMDRPGGTTIFDDKCYCHETNKESSSYIRTDFKGLNQNLPATTAVDPSTVRIQNNGFVQIGTPEDGYQINTGIYDTKYIGCCSNKIIRSASTNISKAYYTSSKQYLQSRGLTYDQKLSINTQAPNAKKNNEYLITSCNNNTNKPYCNTTIYKPSNAAFATQGAVSSSTRLMKLQVDTINKNGNSFRSAWGDEGANAGKYHGTSTTPYFLKSKYSTGLPNC
jgi:hypothetical protein